jgi:hypothetical protein
MPDSNLKLRNHDFSLTTPWRYTGGVGVYFHSFLTSALDWSECSTSRTDRLTSRREHQYPLHMRLGGSQNHSGQYTKRKISCFSWVSIPSSSSTLRSHCTDYAVPRRSVALPYVFFHIHYHIHFSAIERELQTASQNKGKLSKMFHLPCFSRPLSIKGFSWKCHAPFTMPISVVITISLKIGVMLFPCPWSSIFCGLRDQGWVVYCIFWCHDLRLNRSILNI